MLQQQNSRTVLQWVQGTIQQNVVKWRPNVYQRELFYRKSTIGTTIATIEVNNDTYCLQKRIGKFPLT